MCRGKFSRQISSTSKYNLFFPCHRLSIAIYHVKIGETFGNGNRVTQTVSEMEQSTLLENI